LRASVTMTLDGPGGPVDVTAELPPDGLALLESLSGDAPTVDEVAGEAQRLAQVRLILLRSYPELVPDVDRVAGVLRRIPGVAAELERRRAGRG
jgi:hypothetical protein